MRPRPLAERGHARGLGAQLARHAVAAGERSGPSPTRGRPTSGALELGAVEEAVAHLERALGLLDEQDGPGLRAELLLACGRLRTRSARGDERAVELLEQALGALSGPRRRGR